MGVHAELPLRHIGVKKGLIRKQVFPHLEI